MPTAQNLTSTCSAKGSAENTAINVTVDVSKVAAAPSMLLVPIDVVNLAGETIIKENFLIVDKVLAVKDKVMNVTGHPVFLQQLAYEGTLLDSANTLEAHGLSQEGAFVQLTLKSLPENSVLEAAKATLRDGLEAIEAFGNGARPNRDIRELSMLGRPPALCEVVCKAVLYLLAGLEPSLKLKQTGSPKDASWSCCTEMMMSTSFVKSLRDLPDYIDRGKCLPRNVSAAKDQLQMIPGDGNQNKVSTLSPRSTAAARLCAWALCMVEYYEAAAAISEDFGGQCIKDLFPPEAWQ